MFLLNFWASSTHLVVTKLERENVTAKKNGHYFGCDQMLTNVYKGGGKALIIRVNEFTV